MSVIINEFEIISDRQEQDNNAAPEEKTVLTPYDIITMIKYRESRALRLRAH